MLCLIFFTGMKIVISRDRFSLYIQAVLQFVFLFFHQALYITASLIELNNFFIKKQLTFTICVPKKPAIPFKNTFELIIFSQSCRLINVQAKNMRLYKRNNQFHIYFHEFYYNSKITLRISETGTTSLDDRFQFEPLPEETKLHWLSSCRRDF